MICVRSVISLRKISGWQQEISRRRENDLLLLRGERDSFGQFFPTRQITGFRMYATADDAFIRRQGISIALATPDELL